MKFVVIILITYAYTFSKSTALICYECQSESSRFNCKALKDPPNFTSKNCDAVPQKEKEAGAENYCYMTRREVEFDTDNSTVLYSRGCTVGGGITDFCLQQYILQPEINCYLCKGDRCNDGNSLIFKKWLLVQFAVILITFMI